MKKYMIVWNEDYAEFEQLIEKYLADGWKLYGNPFSHVLSSSKGRDDDRMYNEAYFVQAMIKEDSNEG